MIKTRVGFPPNYQEICTRIGKPPAGAVFTYGDTVFLSPGVTMEPGLEVHEATHMRQQELFGAEAWWRRYLDDPTFRLEQEVEAYRRQYLLYRAHLPRKVAREILRKLSKDLCGPMYGNLIRRQVAQDLINP